MRGEVRHDQQPLTRVLALDREHVLIARPAWLGPALDVDRPGATAGCDQPPQPVPQPSLDAGRVVAPLGGLPVHERPVHPAVVLVVAAGRIVEQPQLVAHVDERQPAVRERDRVQQQDAPDRQLDVGVGGCALQPGERGGRPARPRLPRLGLGLEARAARERAGEVPRVEVRQEPAVQMSVLAGPAGVLVGDRPADVVVAPHVGHPARAGRNPRHRLERAGQQPDASRRQRAPQQHHQHVVIRQVTFVALVLTAAQVGDQVTRGDDRLGLEPDARRGDPDGGAERLQQLVNLGLVLAVGPQPLPQKRRRVEAQHVDADLGQIEHRLGHRHEHFGVRVVEIPLEGVERGPHPAVADAREVARGGGGEHVGQRALVRVGPRPIRKGAVEVRTRGPGVLGGGVVEHDVDAQHHPVCSHLGRELAQIVDRAEARLDRAVILDGVAAIVGLRPSSQQRHQVQVTHAELTQVRQPLAYPPQRSCEAIDVRDVADGLLTAQPIGRDLTFVVEPAQLVAALRRGARDRAQQRAPCVGEARIGSVQREQRVAQFGEEALEAHRERRVSIHHLHRRLVGLPHLRSHDEDVLHERRIMSSTARAAALGRRSRDSAIRRGVLHGAAHLAAVGP